MFTIEQRDAIGARIVEHATSDGRVVGGAVVGSLAYATGDAWSDIDLTFAVDDATPVPNVLADWASWMETAVDAITLFDLPSGDTIYRVFLLPEGLQVDLSFTPASRFAAGGPKFRLLFGEVHEKAPAPTTNQAAELFGWGVAYARDARALIERGRFWQAEYMISAVRDHALAIGCIARGLPARYGRGYDDLPADLVEAFAESFVVPPFERKTLLASMVVAVEGLMREAVPVVEIANRVAPSVREWLI